jgi:uncharacterized membrane protein
MMHLFSRLKETNRLPILGIFSLTTALCLLLVGFRVHVTAQVTFVFLVWNMFLALIPYLVSTLLVVYHERIRHSALIFLPLMVWLCFFPNAPYILTDLFHLKQRQGVPYWYDLALILFFAWNGLMVGYASLFDIQTILSQRFNRVVGWLVAVASLALSGFGIYLGRYLRWNSWDVVSSPEGLMRDIYVRIMDPMAHPHTYGVTIIFSAFLVLGYVLLFQFSRVYSALQTRPAVVSR